MAADLTLKQINDRAVARKKYWANPEKARAQKKAVYIREIAVERTRQWRKKNPERVKINDQRARARAKASGRATERELMRLYGLSVAQFENKKKLQFNKCDICSEEFGSRRRDIHVDHCHKTGMLRSRLCCRCNAMIGYARDNPDFLRYGANYIEAWSQKEAEMALTPKLRGAADDLGMGGLLQDQVANETDEMRKKRLQQMQSLGGGMTPATSALFGGLNGLGR